MKVYYPGEKAQRQPSFIMCVAPAATVQNQEVPREWVDDLNNPVQFTIEFIFGAAEVSDSMGKYLYENGLVRKTQLIMSSQDNPQFKLNLDQGG